MSEPIDDPALQVELPRPPRVPLRALVEADRFRAMDRREAYYYSRQDDHKTYDWDGRFRGYGEAAAIQPGWYVPLAQRRPSCRYALPRTIVTRLTAMVFGQDRFPAIRIEDDEEAEDYARELARESRLQAKMVEARNKGGALGTVVLSWGLVGGKPRIRIHNAKHCVVMMWEDEEELRPKRVLKAWSYTRQGFDEKTGKVSTVTFWEVRWFDEMQELRWHQVPDAIAKLPDWAARVTPERAVHGFGFCPVYWVPNTSSSEDYDGMGDYEGLEDTIDEINQVISAATKGTKANVDPTLVIKMDPRTNTGKTRKGSENAIYSTGGAEYLELTGSAVEAAKEQARELRAQVLEAANVVIPEPEKATGQAQSAQAMRITYAPMTAYCDTLRIQYGDHAIVPILKDMLRVARDLASRPASKDEDGNPIQQGIVLADRVEKDDESGTVTTVVRSPGESENVSLNWPPYFPATWQDIAQATTAVTTANGGKPVVSQRTSIAAVASMFGVTDVDAELESLEEQADDDMERAQATFEGQAKAKAGLFGEGGEDEDEPPPED